MSKETARANLSGSRTTLQDGRVRSVVHFLAILDTKLNSKIYLKSKTIYWIVDREANLRNQ